MPQLPEDIIDRITAMERRIQQLSTAVNSRPALNKISGGAVEITDGGSLAVRAPGGTAVFQVGSWSGNEYGVALRRQTGENALTLFNGNGSGTSTQVLRLLDSRGKEIFSDDINAGGIARPWLALLPPQDVRSTNWLQTTATNWSTIGHCENPIWQPKMRLQVGTRRDTGSAGEIRVLLNGVQWGPVVAAPGTFDHTGPVAADMAVALGTMMKIEIQGHVTSATGTVYAQPLAIYGTQS